MFSLNEGKP